MSSQYCSLEDLLGQGFPEGFLLFEAVFFSG